jgi:uncharacterized RDD family membrane protein YckC
MHQPPYSTPREGVPIDTLPPLEGKSFWNRAFAYILDTIIYYITKWAVALLFGVFLGTISAIIRIDLIPSSALPCGVSLLEGLVLTTAYFTIFEASYGATPGKMILRMRVVSTDGTNPGFLDALIRGLFRYFDGLIFGIIAYSSMKPPLHQRYGDKATNTMVIDSRDPAIEQPQEFWDFLIAVALYLMFLLIVIVAELVIMSL